MPVTFQAILCAKWPGSERGSREVYVATPSDRSIRRLTAPQEGWDVEALVKVAAASLPGGPVLVGIDAPIGMPRSLLEALQGRDGAAKHFAEWLDAQNELDSFLAPVEAPGDWRPERPFFKVQAGPGGLQGFADAARLLGVEIRRDIDRRTGAKSPLIASGIPGVAGGSARDVWRGLKLSRTKTGAPAIWPFEVNLAEPGPLGSVVVAEIYPRLASGIALGVGRPPWPIPASNHDPQVGLAALVGSVWFQQHTVRIEGHGGFEDPRHAFDALISAAALLRLVIEGWPLADPAREDRRTEGGMLGMGTVLLPAGDQRPEEEGVMTREEERAYGTAVDEQALLARITSDIRIFGGKPIVRGRRLAVEHVLGLLAAGDTVETILENHPWLERADVQACLVYAKRLVAHERIEPLEVGTRS